MSEHLLYLPDAGSSFEQVGGERVSKGVRTDRFGDTCRQSRLLYDVENHDTGQSPTLVVQEHNIRIAGIGLHGLTLEQVLFDPVSGGFADRDQSLFVAFTDHADKPIVEEEVAESQGDQFRNPKPAAVQRLDHRLIPYAESGIGVEGVDDRLDLGNREYIRKLPSSFGRIDELGRKVLYAVVDQQVVVETLDSAKDSSLRRFFYALVVQVGQKSFDVALFGLLGPDRKFMLEVFGHLFQVADVGLYRVVRQLLLQTYIVDVLL